jgi:hypothetical protein
MPPLFIAWKFGINLFYSPYIGNGATAVPIQNESWNNESFLGIWQDSFDGDEPIAYRQHCTEALGHPFQLVRLCDGSAVSVKLTRALHYTAGAISYYVDIFILNI